MKNMKTINMIRQILAPKYKAAGLLLIAAMFFGALVEIAALAMLMPLVTAFTDPTLFQRNKYLKIVYDYVNPANLEQFMIVAAAAMIAVYILKNLYNFAVFYAQTWYTKKLTLNFTNRVYQNTVARPYEYFLTHDNAELTNRIAQIGTFGQTFMVPFFIAASEILVLFTLGIAMLLLAPQIAIAAIGASAFVLGGFHLLTRRILEKNGKKMHLALNELLHQLTLTFNAVKEIKLAGTDDYFRSKVHNAQNNYMSSVKKFYDIGNIPRMLIESWSIVLAMGILIILLMQGISTTRIIFMAAFFLGAMFRILPSLTRIQHNIFSMKQYYYLFTVIHESLSASSEKINKTAPAEPFRFNDQITLENVSFCYQNNQSRKIIDSFNLNIRKNECIAFTGLSGCGKTTLIDLICGLLTPIDGKICADGTDIQKILTSWQQNIGYVPQDTILFNMSVKENIAIGIDKNKIDEEKLANAIALAQLDDFINSLPQKADTQIGGSNIRVSGGQRQRIAIARALYRNPQILIMDEATSALDANTEEAFADSINTLKGKITILMIAHREKMIAVCDREIRLV